MAIFFTHDFRTWTPPYETLTFSRIRHRHDTDIYNYIVLCHFLKLLSMSTCQCPCCMWCLCLCFTDASHTCSKLSEDFSTFEFRIWMCKKLFFYALTNVYVIDSYRLRNCDRRKNVRKRRQWVKLLA
jgi:hypothetical protein